MKVIISLRRQFHKAKMYEERRYPRQRVYQLERVRAERRHVLCGNRS